MPNCRISRGTKNKINLLFTSSLLLFLFTILQVASSIEIQCSYNTNFNYSILGQVYRCEIQNNFDVASPEDVVVNSVNEKHLYNMSNDNVTGLFSASKNLKYIPKKMENFFKNIKLIDLVDNRIKKVQQDDLKPFPKLIYCGFKDNEIETLENGLFDYNLELELVSFWNNKITQVGPNVFDHLTKLTWLYFDQNPCIDIRVEDNRSGVQKMIQKVTQNCKASNEGASSDTKKEIEELKCLFKNLTTAHENGFTAMTKTTKDLAEKNKKFHEDLNEALERIKVLESKFNNIDVESQNMEVKADVNRNTISKNMEVKADINRNTISQNMEVKSDVNMNTISQQSPGSFE